MRRGAAGEVLHAWRENAGGDDDNTVASLDERATGTTTASLCGFGKREGAEEMDIVGALRDGEEELGLGGGPRGKTARETKSRKSRLELGKCDS